MNQFTIGTLAEHQLRQLIEKDRHAAECKAEWLRRYALEYPSRRDSTGRIITEN